MAIKEGFLEEVTPLLGSVAHIGIQWVAQEKGIPDTGNSMSERLVSRGKKPLFRVYVEN